MRTHVWIRKENEPAWERIADKSAWVNDLLQYERGLPEKTREAIAKDISPKSRRNLKEYAGGNPETCKHGYSPFLCKFAECRRKG